MDKKAGEDRADISPYGVGRTYTVPYVSFLNSLLQTSKQRCSTDVTLTLRRRIQDNTVPATAFKAIKAPRQAGEREENETERGLRVSDKVRISHIPPCASTIFDVVYNVFGIAE